MNAIKDALSGSSNSNKAAETNFNPQETSSGSLGDKLNSALGGGKSSEAKEDYLDKGMLQIYARAPCGEQISILKLHFQVSMHSSNMS